MSQQDDVANPMNGANHCMSGCYELMNMWNEKGAGYDLHVVLPLDRVVLVLKSVESEDRLLGFRSKKFKSLHAHHRVSFGV